MCPKVFQKLFVGNGGFLGSLIECSEVFLVFAKSHAHGIIHEIGHRTLGIGRFDAQGAVKRRVKINGGTLRKFTHGDYLRKQNNAITL